MFYDYLDKTIERTTDKRWKIICCFFKITNIFKMHQHSMKSGDTVMMEKIEADFCGVFLLLKKNNYVEIILSQIEKKFNLLSYRELNDLRVNSSCKYKKDPENKFSFSPMHVLDETMENVNMWVKSLPLGDDNDSWLLHSPNVVLARKCLLFDRVEYRRGLLNFDKLIEEGVVVDRDYNRSNYVKPKKTIEKQRVFEFLISYFGTDEVNDRSSSTKDMFSIVANLKTPLKEVSQQTHTSLYDESLDIVIEDINDLLTNEDTHNNDDLSISSTESNTSEDIANTDTNENITCNSHHKFADIDIINIGIQEMEKKNFVVIRKLKKERQMRQRVFIHSLYDDLSNENNSIRADINWLSDCQYHKCTNSSDSNIQFTRLFWSFKT